jgi:hypothetical protein
MMLVVVVVVVTACVWVAAVAQTRCLNAALAVGFDLVAVHLARALGARYKRTFGPSCS